MIVVAAACALACALLAVTALVMAIRIGTLSDSARAATLAQMKAQEDERDAEGERDSAIADRAKVKAQLDSAVQRLTEVEDQRNTAAADEAKRHGDEVRDAPDAAAALAAFNRLPTTGAGPGGGSAPAGSGPGHA